MGHETLVPGAHNYRGCALKSVTRPKLTPLPRDWTADPGTQTGGRENLQAKGAWSPQACAGSHCPFHLQCLRNWGQRRQRQVIPSLLKSNYPTIVLKAPISFCTCTDSAWTAGFVQRSVETLRAAFWVICAPGGDAASPTWAQNCREGGRPRRPATRSLL